MCGYVWGKRSERIEIPMTNERSKQTYFGAVNIYTGQCLVREAESGNSQETITFLKFLLEQYPNSRLALLWDGASYHRSKEVKEFLESVNQGLDEQNWKITCMRFAPNDPTQNPMEDIWLQAKRFIREHYHFCKSFALTKYFFELVTHRQIFNFPKLFTYNSFLQTT